MSPDLALLLADHRSDNDETLPHVFMGDVTRWYFEQHQAGADATVQALADFLEDEYEHAAPDVENVIAVSFLENLPWPPEPEAAEIARPLGPRLRRELNEMQDWQPETSYAQTDPRPTATPP